MKLQLLIAKLNASLEDQSEHILQSMPRIVREVESLQQESALLKSSLEATRKSIILFITSGVLDGFMRTFAKPTITF